MRQTAPPPHLDQDQPPRTPKSSHPPYFHGKPFDIDSDCPGAAYTLYPSVSGTCERFLSEHKKFELTGPHPCQVVFERLGSLLRIFPELRELRLLGSRIFDTANGSAQDICETTLSERYFRYPEIGALLLYLYKTQVLVLTYRSEEYDKREMRWTRATAEEEFESDCWTVGVVIQ